jgi:hypothetical protein
MFAIKPGGQFVRSAIGPSISAVHPRPAQPSPLSQRCKHEKAAQCSASRYCQKAPQGGNAGPRAFWISASGGSRFCARLMPPICQGDAGREGNGVTPGDLSGPSAASTVYATGWQGGFFL